MDELLRAAVIHLRGMWTHRWVGLATAWVIGVIALGVILSLPPKYEASARIFVNTDSILKPLMTGLTVQPNEDQRIVMLSRVVISRPNVAKLVQTVGLDAEVRSQQERERIIDGVMTSLQMRAAGRDNLYTLTFRDSDPARARQAVDILASMFIESSKGGKVQDTEAAKRFIEEQVAVYEKKLQEAENKLKDFRIRNMGLTPGAEGRDFFAQLSEAERLLNQARLELREAERARDAYRRGLAAEEPAAGSAGSAAPSPVTSAALAEMDNRIDAQRRNLDVLLQRFTEGHPDVVGARRVIQDLEAQRRRLAANVRADPNAIVATTTTGARASETLKVSLAQAEASVASLSSRVAEYSERYNRLKSSAARIPQVEAELAQLNRDYEVNKRNYESLVGRRESAAISGEMQTVAGVSDFRLVDPPRVSPRPVSPNTRLLVPLALLLSLAAGAAAAYVMREMRPTFYDGRALREVTGLPLLGVVSVTETEAQVRAWRQGLARFLGGAGALVGVYVAGFIAIEFLMVRST